MASISGTVDITGDLTDYVVLAYDAETHALAGQATPSAGTYEITGLVAGRAYRLMFCPLTGPAWSASTPRWGDLILAVPVDTVDHPHVYQAVGQTGDSQADDVVLLLRMDGADDGAGFVDGSPYARDITRGGGVVTKTGTKKFGTASAYFDGDGDYLSVPYASDLELADQGMALELWIKTASSTQFATLVSKENGAFNAGAWVLLINNASSTAGDLAVYVREFHNTKPLLATSGVNIRDDEWHFVQWVRDGNDHYLYVDGVQRASRAATSLTLSTLNAPLYIGGDQTFGRWYTGYIDSLRLTLGAARAATLPTEDYTSLITGATEPEWPENTGGTVVDNEITWTCRGYLTRPLGHGPVIAT